MGIDVRCHKHNKIQSLVSSELRHLHERIKIQIQTKRRALQMITKSNKQHQKCCFVEYIYSERRDENSILIGLTQVKSVNKHLTVSDHK